MYSNKVQLKEVGATMKFLTYVVELSTFKDNFLDVHGETTMSQDFFYRYDYESICIRKTLSIVCRLLEMCNALQAAEIVSSVTHSITKNSLNDISSLVDNCVRSATAATAVLHSGLTFNKLDELECMFCLIL